MKEKTMITNNSYPLTLQPERNHQISRSDFRAAYRDARSRRVTHGIFSGATTAELYGPGYYWLTPDDIAAAALSMRQRRDYMDYTTPGQRLEAVRELERREDDYDDDLP